MPVEGTCECEGASYTPLPARRERRTMRIELHRRREIRRCTPAHRDTGAASFWRWREGRMAGEASALMQCAGRTANSSDSGDGEGRKEKGRELRRCLIRMRAHTRVRRGFRCDSGRMHKDAWMLLFAAAAQKGRARRQQRAMAAARHNASCSERAMRAAARIEREREGFRFDFACISEAERLDGLCSGRHGPIEPIAPSRVCSRHSVLSVKCSDWGDSMTEA